MLERPIYVVILAGGEGTRLASLTRALYGVELPKQFAVLAGERSLLQETVERASRLTTLDRVLVVVTSHREAIAREQLAGYPGVELVVQPRNLDTAPGLLLPLARIRRREPGARVVFLPSDHYVTDARPLVRAIRASARPALRERVTLIGAEATAPETEYGWIVPGVRLGRGGARAVDRFVEKPAPALAEALWRAGALWNTFVSVGPVEEFWTLAQRHLPDHASAFADYARTFGTRYEADALDDTYRQLAPANFSRDILGQANALAVAPLAGSGWSDWGSPQRVFASLAGTASHDRLVARIREVALAS